MPRRMKIYHCKEQRTHVFQLSRLFFDAQKLSEAEIVEASGRKPEIRRALGSRKKAEVHLPRYEIIKLDNYLLLLFAYAYPSVYHFSRLTGRKKKARGFKAGGRGIGAVFHLKAVEHLANIYGGNIWLKIRMPSPEFANMIEKAGLDVKEDHTLEEHISAFRRLVEKQREKHKPK